VELGVVLIVMVVLFLGLVDVGYLLNHTITLENAAREGMRIGITGYSDERIVAAIQNATVGLDASRLRWAITPAVGEVGREPGGTLTVELWYEDRPPLPLAGLFENPFTLHACRKGRIEGS
jgi:Flp pilus assembly protein TadG